MINSFSGQAYLAPSLRPMNKAVVWDELSVVLGDRAESYSLEPVFHSHFKQRWYVIEEIAP